jgi:predicted dehydrogenase
VFDTLRYLIGEVKSIRGLGGTMFNPDRAPQVDVALGLLEFENGCIGAVELGTASEWCVADEEFFVACDNAVVRWRGGFDRPSEIYYTLRDKQEPQTHSINYDGAAGDRDFEAEIRDLMSCIEKGGQPLASGWDAARSIAVCQAMKQAVREGGVVEVSYEA